MSVISSQSRLPSPSQRKTLAALDWFMLALFDKLGSLSRSELAAEARHAAGKGTAVFVTDHVVYNWWAFARRRRLLKMSDTDELATLSDDGRTRLLQTTDDVYATGAIKFYGRLVKGGLPLLISLAALLVAGAEEAIKQPVLISVLANALTLGALLAIALPGLYVIAACRRRFKRKTHFKKLAADHSLPIKRERLAEQLGAAA